MNIFPTETTHFNKRLYKYSTLNTIKCQDVCKVVHLVRL